MAYWLIIKKNSFEQWHPQIMKILQTAVWKCLSNVISMIIFVIRFFLFQNRFQCISIILFDFKKPKNYLSYNFSLFFCWFVRKNWKILKKIIHDNELIVEMFLDLRICFLKILDLLTILIDIPYRHFLNVVNFKS